MYLQVLFNYSPNYVTTYCNPVGTSYLAQSTTAPGFSIPNHNPPQLVSPVASALSRALQYVRSMRVHTRCPGRPQLPRVRPVSAQYLHSSTCAGLILHCVYALWPQAVSLLNL